MTDMLMKWENLGTGTDSEHEDCHLQSKEGSMEQIFFLTALREPYFGVLASRTVRG
jgi:hypothetical protein